MFLKHILKYLLTRGMAFTVTLPTADYQSSMRPQSAFAGIPIVDPVSRASVAGDNPVGFFATKMSGTNAMSTLSVPAGFRGLVVILPSAAVTTVTGGTYATDGISESIPFQKAATLVADRAILFMVTGAAVWPFA